MDWLRQIYPLALAAQELLMLNPYLNRHLDVCRVTRKCCQFTYLLVISDVEAILNPGDIKNPYKTACDVQFYLN